jgi:hypothetical protein
MGQGRQGSDVWANDVLPQAFHPKFRPLAHDTTILRPVLPSTELRLNESPEVRLLYWVGSPGVMEPIKSTETAVDEDKIDFTSRAVVLPLGTTTTFLNEGAANLIYRIHLPDEAQSDEVSKQNTSVLNPEAIEETEDLTAKIWARKYPLLTLLSISKSFQAYAVARWLSTNAFLCIKMSRFRYLLSEYYHLFYPYFRKSAYSYSEYVRGSN